jgi:uncharacterized protein (DUF4415 family)
MVENHEAKSTSAMLPANILNALKSVAAHKGKPLREVHNDAVVQFLEKRKSSGQAYYAAPRKGRENVTIWLSADVLEEVRHYANQDGVTVTTVIFNSFLNYCRAEGIQIDET